MVIIVACLAAIGAYLARDTWISINLNVSNHTEWLEVQKYKAYTETKKVCSFKDIDTEKNLSETFRKAEPFLESRLNIIVASVAIPVWSVFLSKLQMNDLTQLLAFFIFVGSTVVYFNWMFFYMVKLE